MFPSRFLARFVAVALLVLAIAPLGASSANAATRHHHAAHHHARHARHHHALPVSGEAHYADIVVEARTGKILHAVNPDSLRHPASLTKMMTLYITFQALEAGKLKLDQRLPISSNASAQSPSKLCLRPGQSIRVGDAILGLVTESANDAAVVLAEALGGDEDHFGQMMTRQARALGMTQTVFHNPSGLPDPDQVTTAHDMATLGLALLYHYPQFYPYFSHEAFLYNGRAYHNHNHLMQRYDGMDGIKTGYVRASGFNLVASAARNNTRLVGVVFGGKSTVGRDNQMAQLLDAGFLCTTQGSRGENLGALAIPPKVAAVFPPPSLNRPLTPAAMTTAPAPQPVPAPEAEAVMPRRIDMPPASAWSVQVGAYNDDAVGHQALANDALTLPQFLGHAEQVLVKTPVGDGSFVYRGRFTSLNEGAAKNVCAALTKRGESCVVIGPEVSAR